jgi:putative membrane protein
LLTPLLRKNMTVNLSSLPFPKFAAAMRLSFTPLQGGLFLIWLLAMIALPIALYFWGAAALPWSVASGVFFQSGFVVAILHRAWGLPRTIRAVLLVVGLAWLAEAVGTATGYPFGLYDYTTKLQPQVAHVPLLIPLAWLMMLPPAWIIAYRIAGTWSGPVFVALSALALTAWDLFLDPQMVRWGFWVWTEPGGYFGIPWLNFLGWLLTTAIITLAVRPRNLPVFPLLLVYVLTWLLETGGLIFFWGLPGPGLVGFLGMGSLIGLAWFRHKRRNKWTS